MSETVHQYRVWVTDAPAHFDFVWGTIEPTVGPNGENIDTAQTVVVRSIEVNDINIKNFPITAFGESITAEMSPFLQLNFVYNIADQIFTTSTTGTGSVSVADSMANTATGASASSKARLESKMPLKYHPGQGVLLRFTGVFTSGAAGSTQQIGSFDDENGVGFGYNGADFGLFHRNDSVTNWTNQTDWNLDKLDGTDNSGVNIDFSSGFGNVFQINFQFLGFGSINYYVENPGTGEFINVHVLGYSNSASVPNFTDPTFPLALEAENTSNTSDISLKSASLMGAIEGKLEIKNSQEFITTWLSLAIGNGTETLVKAFNIKSTFNSKPNKVFVFFEKLSATTGLQDKPQILRIRKNPTFTSPVWTDVDTTQSVVQLLTSGTWNEDGEEIVVQVIAGKGDPNNILYDFNTNSKFLGLRNETFIFTLEGINGTGENTGSITWLEDQ